MLLGFIIFVTFLQKQNITPPKDKKVLNKYKMNDIINTNCNNLVTIDNNYASQSVSNSRLVRYDGVLDPDKYHSTNFA